MERHSLAILLALACGAAALSAAEVWQKKKYTEWTQKDIQKITSDSPWARQAEVPVASSRRAGRMRGGASTSSSENRSSMRGGRMESSAELTQTVPIIVRWHTALPIKQAVARARYGDEVATSAEAQKTFTRQETHYVVGLIGLPGYLARADPAVLKQKTVLRVKGQAAIPLQEFQAGREEGRADLFLFFPRGQDGARAITLADEEVELVVPLGDSDLKRKFRLKDMVFNGKLEM